VVLACAEILFVVVFAVARRVLDGDAVVALIAIPIGVVLAAPFVVARWLPRNVLVAAIAAAGMLAVTTVVLVDVLRDETSTAGIAVPTAIGGAWVIWAVGVGVDAAARRWGERRAAHVAGSGASLVDAGGQGE
jgi:hypothetical protein